MQYKTLVEEKDITKEELQKLAIQIAEAEERGDTRESEVLKTQLPFTDKFISWFKPLLGEEGYNQSIIELKEYIEIENRKVLRKYLVN